MFEKVEKTLVALGDFAWGSPLLVLLLGGGSFFLVYSGLRPHRHLFHAVQVLFGRHETSDAPGQISHFQALSTALSATVGLGNIAGVAAALSMGGPGALLWMWLTALLGTATKFFTCTLAVMYRGKNAAGEVRGGPMYYIVGGLGPGFRPLAIAFAALGLVGCLPLVVGNQLVRVVHELFVQPVGVSTGVLWADHLVVGVLLAIVCALVIFGGLSRVARLASSLVPLMTISYLGVVLAIALARYEAIPGVLALVVRDAFTGEAVAGGSLGTVMMIGIRRGAFSNEAGIGTEALAHGAARTAEPVREGLVAMLGPLIDTLLVCTATGLAILLSGIPLQGSGQGVSMTLAAFRAALPVVYGVPLGTLVLGLAALVFGLTTLFGYSYYGGKCLEFLVGERFGDPYRNYNAIYVLAIVACAPATLKGMFGFLDACFAFMAWPTMTAALLLAPRVKAAARDYFERLAAGRISR